MTYHSTAVFAAMHAAAACKSTIQMQHVAAACSTTCVPAYKKRVAECGFYMTANDTFNPL
jgi:hypothetical protein